MDRRARLVGNNRASVGNRPGQIRPRSESPGSSCLTTAGGGSKSACGRQGNAGPPDKEEGISPFRSAKAVRAGHGPEGTPAALLSRADNHRRKPEVT